VYTRQREREEFDGKTHRYRSWMYRVRFVRKARASFRSRYRICKAY
jgi:hypothetical protein